MPCTGMRHTIADIFRSIFTKSTIHRLLNRGMLDQHTTTSKLLMSVKLTRSPEVPSATPLRGVVEEIKRNPDMSRLLASVLTVVEREVVFIRGLASDTL